MAARPPAGGPPGLSGPACAPPLEPPPPAPPGLFLGSSRPAVGGLAPGADEGAFEKQAEISGTIASQVTRLLEQARLDTENKVKTELKGIGAVMMTMNGRLDQLLAQLDGIEPRAEPPLDAEHIGQVLSKIEQSWGQEIRTLKEELHQTILAHNHNADLIKHHKDTIDALRDRCQRFQGRGHSTSAEIQQQMARLDAMARQQQTHRKMDPLFERLAGLERNVAHVAAARSAAWRYPAMPPMPMMPGMRPPMGIPAMMASMGAAAGLVHGKGAGMRPPLGGRGGAMVLPSEAEFAALGANIDNEEESTALASPT